MGLFNNISHSDNDQATVIHYVSGSINLNCTVKKSGGVMKSTLEMR